MKKPRQMTRPCYDCGSVIKGEHSNLCHFAKDGEVRLPLEHSTRGGEHPSGYTQHLSPEAKAAQRARLEAASRA